MVRTEEQKSILENLIKNKEYAPYEITQSDYDDVVATGGNMGVFLDYVEENTVSYIDCDGVVTSTPPLLLSNAPNSSSSSSSSKSSSSRSSRSSKNSSSKSSRSSRSRSSRSTRSSKKNSSGSSSYSVSSYNDRFDGLTDYYPYGY